MFWGAADAGMRRLVAECDALPNKLWGNDRALTRLDRIEAVVCGLLESEVVYTAVARWPRFARSHGPGTLISSRVFEDLNGLREGMVPDLPKLTLIDVIEAHVGPEQKIGPEFAAVFGALISPGFMTDQADKSVASRREIEALGEELTGLQFQGLDGNWHPAGELLVAGGDDEGLRAAFAPARCVLSRDYAGDAVQFFRACRQQMDADPARLKGWAIAATEEPRRKAFLDYLLRGELGLSAANSCIPQMTRTLAVVKQSGPT